MLTGAGVFRSLVSQRSVLPDVRRSSAAALMGQATLKAVARDVSYEVNRLFEAAALWPHVPEQKGRSLTWATCLPSGRHGERWLPSLPGLPSGFGRDHHTLRIYPARPYWSRHEIGNGTGVASSRITKKSPMDTMSTNGLAISRIGR